MRHPILHPFGTERTGHRVDDLHTGIDKTVRHCATREVAILPGPTARHAVVQWPGDHIAEIHAATAP